jgi:hypothetical protein
MDHEHDDIDAEAIAHCRKILAREADGLTDAEVDQIRRHADAMAHVLVEVFLTQQRSQE